MFLVFLFEQNLSNIILIWKMCWVRLTRNIMWIFFFEEVRIWVNAY